ncbi:MAG: hypothetical protein ACREJB_02380 [Planctomycetaceae bacterium]
MFARTTLAVRPAACLSVIWAWSAVAAPARAEENLQAEMAVVAEAVAEYLGEHDAAAVSLGDFRGPKALAATGGPVIVSVLGEQLRQREIETANDADYQVRGAYADVIDANSKLLAALITVELVNARTGDVALSVNRGLFGEVALATLFGATVELKPNAETQTRSKRLGDRLEEPEVHLSAARVSPEEDCPYGIELLVRPAAGRDGQFLPRVPKDDNGLAFVHVNRSEVYAIRLINNSPHDAAVTLTVDGLNVYRFHGNLGFPQILLPAGTSGLIEGWPRDGGKVDAFRVQDYGRSKQGRTLHSATNVGTITACFSASWKPTDAPPADEPQSPAETAEADRTFGVLRAAISVRFVK